MEKKADYLCQVTKWAVRTKTCVTFVKLPEKNAHSIPPFHHSTIHSLSTESRHPVCNEQRSHVVCSAGEHVGVCMYVRLTCFHPHPGQVSVVEQLASTSSDCELTSSSRWGVGGKKTRTGRGKEGRVNENKNTKTLHAITFSHDIIISPLHYVRGMYASFRLTWHQWISSLP
jgi:hypothetical protein